MVVFERREKWEKAEADLNNTVVVAVPAAVAVEVTVEGMAIAMRVAVAANTD